MDKTKFGKIKINSLHRDRKPAKEKKHKWVGRFVQLKQNAIARHTRFQEGDIFRVTARQRWVQEDEVLCTYYGDNPLRESPWMHGGVPFNEGYLEPIYKLPIGTTIIFLGKHSRVPTRTKAIVKGHGGDSMVAIEYEGDIFYIGTNDIEPYNNDDASRNETLDDMTVPSIQPGAPITHYWDAIQVTGMDMTSQGQPSYYEVPDDRDETI